MGEMGEMAIRIGNQSALSALTTTEPFEYAVENGFDAFEWFPDKNDSGGGWEEADLDAEARRNIKNTAVKHDIALSVHAPWNLNPLEPNAYERLLESLEFARDIGATLINIHLYIDEGVDAYVRAIVPFVRHLAKFDIRLSIENTPITGPEHFNELFARLRDLKPATIAHVGMCFDLGHANLFGSTRNDYLAFIDQLDPQVPLIHLHVHENYGDYDSHLPLFTGPSQNDVTGVQGFVERVKKRNFSGSIILEQWPQLPSLLNQARDRLCRMFGHYSVKPAVKPTGADGYDFADTIVTFDRRCRSWRKKLESVRGILADEAFQPDNEKLIYLAIYLRFLGTREIACGKNGRHFRPSRCAKMASQIHERLAAMITPDNAFIIRKIYPWLPSCDSAFTRAEPLTRIRDIAHRNDISRELKQEIKHTLQNKLHGCAGPEDLATSAALLERITAPDADYPPAFVEQFKIFHEELKEFFNARSLEERLQEMITESAADEAGLIRKFLAAKAKLDTPDQQVLALNLLTALRQRFLASFGDSANAEAQKLILADIWLEDFSFVLLSRLVNHVDAQQEGIPWAVSLNSLALTVENLRLSGISPEESRVIESEVNAWRHKFVLSDRRQLIRLKATLDRSRRLADDYTEKVLTLFPESVEKLGRALGVAEHAIKVFCEADIRGNLVFQLSKLVSGLLRIIRTLLDLPPWDTLVTGTVAGRVAAAKYLDDLPDPIDEPVIVFLEKAQGDEYIPRGVVGIILAHEIPHLSHLGVRARQADVVFAVCEVADRFAELEHLVGKQLSLEVNAEGVNLTISPTVAGSGKTVMRHGPIRLPDVRLAFDRPLIPLGETRLANGGSKAGAARRLEELSGLDRAGFRTPPGLVVPYGVMESSLRRVPALEQEYWKLVKGLDGVLAPDFEEALNRLRDLVAKIEVEDEIVSGVMDRFTHNERLVVRSSANCEDLEQLTAAGLYDSVANVLPTGVADAVRRVWASLWTRRAATGRKEAGIPHNKAHMAVLIQLMITPDFSFIMHTVNPINRNTDEIYVELAVGLGETLASGATQGTPFRMVCNKQTGEISVLAFANFSHALWPDTAGGICRRIVDYSRIELSRDAEMQDKVGGRLAAIGHSIGEAFGRPQDIEGGVVGDDVYVVQSRAQLKRP